MSAQTVSLTGGVLVVTEDPDLVAAQLAGACDVPPRQLIREPLRDNISTDEIIPGWCCYWYDEKLGDYAYLGLRDRRFAEGDVRKFAPQVIVSGAAKGCGSSREHAVYAERYAGVEIVFARSFEKIYEQNCRNVGIITCDDFDVLEALLAGERLPLTAFVRRANGLERAIIDAGGLFAYNRRRGEAATPAVPAEWAGPRPLNRVEKIVQKRLSARNPLPDGATVHIGESYFIETDVRFSHEYVTAMAAGMFAHQFGDGAVLADAGSCYFFQDHLSLAPAVLGRRADGPQLVQRIEGLNRRQREFAQLAGGVFVGPQEAICHNYMVERVARPGQVVIGTDSHTCTAGAVGAFAFGVGATDIANAWYNREILVKVPEVIRIDLAGALRPGVCAKDLVLGLLAHPELRDGRTLGRVLLYGGPGLSGLDMDERATLANMAVEAGAITALVEPDELTARFLAGRAPAGSTPEATDTACDPGATYHAVVHIDLSTVEPMVALPGDPRNAIRLDAVTGEVRVDKVYGGSCTGGKAHDMDMYASVFALARERGAAVAPGVEAYIQVGSEAIMRYARERGYVELFEAVGARLLPPSCGACINAGPGASYTPEEITVSAQNRNFPGRSGPGQVYLASPYVVAATAIAGRLCSVEDMFNVDGAR
ncbi:aconitase family protein [Dactylosporangium sp. CA-092794]|uniref:aconitase family protein n=1 Tax=Dactylosporangium sp. CA-092794 TaxID=3239929 RepID=UPI003D943CBD